jgi:leucine dehydrogenase
MMSMSSSRSRLAEYEEVCFFRDPDLGLSGIIAIHSTARGPALGGCRMYPYASEADALRDALRLSKAMSYKAAVMDLPFGGGKAVVIADPRRDKTEALLRGIGGAVDALGGRYIVADDVGTTVQDMNVIRTVTRFAAGFPTADGEACPATACGVYHGIRAVARHAFGRTDLEGLTVAVQGLGSVGFRLGRLLAYAGARLLVADVRADVVDRAVDELGAVAVSSDEILYADADVLAPCALGGMLDDRSIPRLRCRAIAGAANNQLAEPRHAEAIRRCGILYAPDYVVNAGGIIDVAHEGPDYDAHRVLDACGDIDTVLSDILDRAKGAGVTPLSVADRLAEARMIRSEVSRSRAA